MRCCCCSVLVVDMPDAWYIQMLSESCLVVVLSAGVLGVAALRASRRQGCSEEEKKEGH